MLALPLNHVHTFPLMHTLPNYYWARVYPYNSRLHGRRPIWPPQTARLLAVERMAGKEDEKQERDELADSLNDLFTNLSTMIKGDLQGTNNLLELLEKMNLRVAEEYKGLGDVASGLRVFMEQLKAKSGSFDEYVQQIDAIEQQVTEFEAVISMLDKYVSLLESKVQPFYQVPPS
ncbi:hypothetical protein RHGRI_023133 [Rhododendron griersonianum]|uniref:Biogenesis of lysosome-related organelles complex 1 subunit 2 n=1 Tax=Rhododendron griersonianum TaxID=479676 RepID=A0AAV6J7U7_9ERIC|nr:hypothetical protein RHGRI_023133 [Rhododendron griersonianum]